MSTYVVKVGSSIVARQGGELRIDRLEHLVSQIAAVRERGDEVVVVTSGAIACGMHALGLDARPREMDELQAASAVGQGRLYRVYSDLLRDAKVPSAQVLLTFHDMSARTQYVNARATLKRLLAWRVLPIINENDTTATDEISFGDNDFLSAQVAILVGACRLVILTNTDGLYARDPRGDPSAALIEDVTDFAAIESFEIGAEPSPLGLGGMRSKVLAAEMATAAGIATVVCNGNSDGSLVRALMGEREGTLFHPQDRRISSFKLWLRYAKQARGRVLVDDGAATALADEGKSLLPVGVVAVKGRFEAGDAVEIVRHGDGSGLGKGISNYSSEELGRIMGLHSGDVRRMLPRASDEAVHRDYLVLA